MKPVLLLSAILLISTASFAQPKDFERKSFSVGPVVGLGHSWIAPYANARYMPSFSAGAFAIYSPIEHWGIGIDVRYSVEGSRIEEPEFGTRNERINYVRVPIRMMYFCGQWGDNFRPKFTLGPTLGFLVGYEGPVNSSENTLDFGLTSSAGFNYLVYPATWLNVDLSYYQGFSDVIQHTGMREMNGNVQLNVGIAFDI
jgi:hypothetical protein